MILLRKISCFTPLAAAQIFNLLYRGFSIRRTPEISGRFRKPEASPNAIRRYRRSKICATSKWLSDGPRLALSSCLGVLAVVSGATSVPLMGQTKTDQARVPQLASLPFYFE